MYKILLGFTASDESYENFEEAQTAAFNLATEHQLQPEIIEIKGKVILKPIFISVEEEGIKILDNFPPATPEPKSPPKKKQKAKVELETKPEILEPKQIVKTFEVIDIGSEVEEEDMLQDQKENEETQTETTPLEQAIEEVKNTDEKMYKCSLGIQMKEDAVKQSCETKFNESLDKEKTSDNFKAIIRNLVSLYPEIDSEDWFDEMVNEKIKTLSAEEENKYIKSFLIDKIIEKIEKVTSIEELQEIAKANKDLNDESYIKAFEKKSDEFSLKDLEELQKMFNNPKYDADNLTAIHKMPKYQALTLTKYKDEYNKLVDVITQKKKIELQVEQLISKLPTVIMPEKFILNYSTEVQNHPKIYNYFTEKLGIFLDGSKVPF